MEYLILLGIGLCMGFFGGLLGIGGSVIMIPAMVLAFGENQHLYQAAAMICNFFVGASSTWAHKKARTLEFSVLKIMIPCALLGIVAGVGFSNSRFFSGPRSYLLARIFGGFLVYVALYNIYRLKCSFKYQEPLDLPAEARLSGVHSGLIGMVTGLGAGLLGIGAGTVATPLQQLLLRMPLRRAISNSALTIMSIAWLGALYKNFTLSDQGIRMAPFAGNSAVGLSLRIALFIVPTAVLGGLAGGHLTHRLPRNLVRAVFTVVVILAAVRLLTVQPHG